MALNSNTDFAKAAGACQPSTQSIRLGLNTVPKANVDELLNSTDLLTIVTQCRLLQISPTLLYSGLKTSVTTAKHLKELFSLLIFPFLKRLLQRLGSSWNDDATTTFNEECLQFIRDMLCMCMKIYVQKELPLLIIPILRRGVAAVPIAVFSTP